MRVGEVYYKTDDWFVVSFVYFDDIFDAISKEGEVLKRKTLKEDFPEYELKTIYDKWWKALYFEKENEIISDTDTKENRVKALKFLGGGRAVSRFLKIGYSTVRRFAIKGHLNETKFALIKNLCVKAGIQGAEYWKNGITSVSEELNRKNDKRDKKR